MKISLNMGKENMEKGKYSEGKQLITKVARCLGSNWVLWLYYYNIIGYMSIFRRFVIPTWEIRLNKLNKLKLNKLIAMSE